MHFQMLKEIIILQKTNRNDQILFARQKKTTFLCVIRFELNQFFPHRLSEL